MISVDKRNIFFVGLVDSSNEEEFESKLVTLKEQW